MLLVLDLVSLEYIVVLDFAKSLRNFGAYCLFHESNRLFCV